MPDSIIEPRDAFVRLLAQHRQTGADLTLGLFPTETPWKFGMVQLDEHDRVVYNIDKPKQTDLRYMWGFCCWNQSFSDLMHDFLRRTDYGGKEIVLSQVFDEAIRQGLHVQGMRFDDGRYLDIGTAEELDVALKTFHL
ncbi:MAG: sugar phosphate nucleotidyltransferase [Anaerolineae bacterium]|nr:sugar phosphate nucleotidyltransferase [Thermoflexales bacterium]MDW8407453.1 sugar phosphate nucleotidyltransferase [Anaerolineae bacterium]